MTNERLWYAAVALAMASQLAAWWIVVGMIPAWTLFSMYTAKIALAFIFCHLSFRVGKVGDGLKR